MISCKTCYVPNNKSLSRYYKVYCKQCNALSINGIACHEHGCPNSKKPWVVVDNKLVPGVIELDDE